MSRLILKCNTDKHLDLTKGKPYEVEVSEDKTKVKVLTDLGEIDRFPIADFLSQPITVRPKSNFTAIQFDGLNLDLIKQTVSKTELLKKEMPNIGDWFLIIEGDSIVQINNEKFEEMYEI